MKKLDEPIGIGRIAEVFAWDDGQVLKLARDWVSASSVDYEYRMTKAVHKAGIHSPAPLERIQFNGRHGIVYERVDGPTMLDKIGVSPFKFAQFGRQLGQLHLAIHKGRVEEGALPDNYKRLRQKIKAAHWVDDSVKKLALKKLDELPKGDSVLHGDFHPDNIVMTVDGPITIDWPDAARGHPLGDVARTWLLARLGGLPSNLVLNLIVRILRSGLQRAYLKTYFRGSDYKLSNLKKWLFPVAVARLSENIEGEKSEALKLIRQWARN